MPHLKAIAIPTDLAAAVRSTMSSPGYGHPASIAVAKGHGPCRHCLQPFVIGEDRRILFTLNSFTGLEAIPQPGPVFIHERTCNRYEAPGYPSALLPYGAVLDAYDANHTFLRRETILDGTQESILHRLFEDETIHYVIVRDAKAGCYDFRVERA